MQQLFAGPLEIEHHLLEMRGRARYHLARLLHIDVDLFVLGARIADQRQHLVDVAGNLGRRHRHPFGQLAHLVGDDGKAAPASPARAASIAAFSASRLVWSATSRISAAIWLIEAERWDRSSTVWLKRSTFSPTPLILLEISCISRREMRAPSRLVLVESEISCVLCETSSIACVASVLAVEHQFRHLPWRRAPMPVSSTRTFTCTASVAMPMLALRISLMIPRIFSAKRL